MTPESHSTRLMAGRASHSGRAAVLVDKLDSCVEHAATLLIVRSYRNANLTHGKITIGKLHPMDDSSWIDLREPWERLRWARMAWQRRSGSASTGVAAAESLGLKENTYTAYERPPTGSKHTPLDHQRAIQFAKKFKTNWVWLLTGDETPFGRTEAQNKAVTLMSMVDEREQEHVVDIIEAALKRKTA